MDYPWHEQAKDKVSGDNNDDQIIRVCDSDICSDFVSFTVGVH